MRISRFPDPSGKEHTRKRRHDQRSPKYALVTSRDGKNWFVHTVTESEKYLFKCLMESAKKNKFSCVVIPKVEHNK